MLVNVGAKSFNQTYGIACVAVACNVTLATAKVDAGVLLGVTPCLPLAFRHVVDGHCAAGDDGVVLGSGKASKSRDGDDDGGVEHGEVVVWRREYQCLRERAESAGDQHGSAVESRWAVERRVEGAMGGVHARRTCTVAERGDLL